MRTMGSMPSTSQGAAPGGPGGKGRPDPAQMMKENPDMLKQASEMMSNMSEEDLKTMAKMSGMPEDSMKPEMMKADDLEKITKLAQQDGGEGSSKVEKIQKATEVLSQMSPETVMGVSKEMGYEMSEGQAKMMTTVVSFISTVLKALLAIKNFILGRWFLALAVLVLLVALFMRR